ncbi:MAG TPA: ABC transporter permease [Pyrinomonadaceae bacterium]
MKFTVLFDKPHLKLIALVGIIVPRRLRADWIQEWEAELKHRELLLVEWNRLNWRNRVDLIRRSTSAFCDALWLQPRRLEDEFMQDLLLGFRMLRKHSASTTIIVLTLAIGIGANIAIFSVVNGLLLRALPYQDSDRLVFLWAASPAQNVQERPVALATTSDWRDQNTSFEDLAVFDPTSVTLTGAGDPEQVMSVRASANLLPLLGVTPLLGRTFTPDEARQKSRVAVISYGLWQRLFGASQDVLGHTLEIDGASSQVIGVMPESFEFPKAGIALWEPNTLTANWERQQAQRGAGSWRVVGRLKPHVTLDQAQTEMNTIAERLEHAFPESNKDLSVNLVPLRIQLTGRNVRLALWVLFGAVICVLLIACTNAANLMLARGIAREREMEIRMALGAGRMRLIRQLLTESSLVALLAGVVGLLVAFVSLKVLISSSSISIADVDHVGINGRVLVFTVMVSLLTGLLFGIAPALKISQSRPGAVLHGTRTVSGGVAGSRLRGLLIVAEFGLAVSLLSGAGLLVRSFMHLQAVDPGFDPTQILILQTAPAQNNTSDQIRLFYRQVNERLAALPGVESVGLSEEIFISGNPQALITIEHDSANSAESLRIPLRQDDVTEGFFRTLRVPLRHGRFFDVQDSQGSVPVTIINETMARRCWRSEETLGRRFKLGAANSNSPWLTVVGVVGDMRRQGLEREPIAQVFLPHEQSPSRRMNVLLRTKSEPTQLAAVVGNEIRSIDKTVLIYGISTLESRLDTAVAARRFQTWLLTLFSALALLLAAIGIYGLLHQSVALRIREIGTRMALGAQPRDVLRLIIGEGISLALCGTGVGWLLALWSMRVLSGLLFGITANDPTTFIAVPLLLLSVAVLACYLPARRATRIDPIVALRADH